MNLITLLIIAAIVSIVLVSFYILRKTATIRDRLVPDLMISVENDDDDMCGIKLTNNGSGTAIIKEISFWNENTNGSEKKSIDEVFSIRKFYWMNNTQFSNDKDYFLAAGDSLYFGKLNKSRVLERGGNFMKTKLQFEDDIKNIKIKVNYNDMLDIPQDPLVFNN
jgi:hypothetical protein